MSDIETPLEEIKIDDWPNGWLPSSSDTGNLGQDPGGLLRMDNLTLDEAGSLRISRGYSKESTQTFQDIIAMFATTLPNYGRIRYVYAGDGKLYRNGAFTSLEGQTPRNINFILASNIAYTRAAFNAILGHTFICIGATQYKDRGLDAFPLVIPTPTILTPVANATPTKDLSNLDGGGNYTNWTSIDTSSFTNSSTEIDATPDVGNEFAVFQTIYSSPIDTTNLNGAGNDTPDDIFSFQFEIDDATQIWAINLTFYQTTPSGSNISYTMYKEWDYPNPDIGFVPTTLYQPFPLQSSTAIKVTWKRSDFIQVSSDKVFDWTSIKAVRVTLRFRGTANIKFSKLTVAGGATSTITDDSIQYVQVWVRDCGTFLEFSPASPESTAISTVAGNTTITPGPVDTQVNQWWLFRKDTATGEYLRVTSQTGATGFTPAPYNDFRTSDSLIEDATINPQYTLQFYRTALPTNIIDIVWFRDRMIYLTSTGFIPSFLLDPGSYDSRFTYELAGGGGNSEQCLFIVKLDVANFVVATTKDWYRVTGTFEQITDPTTGITTLDVNIYPLASTDPAISRAHTEISGSIVYMSATGLRMFTNYVSNLINDSLDLLFRKEVRYGLSPIQLTPGDTMPIAMISSGNRVIVSLPFQDGQIRVVIINFNTSGYNPLNYSRTWRLWTRGDLGGNPTAFAREEDGTILFGSYNGNDNFVYGFETDYNFLPIKLLTQYYYNNKPDVRKDLASIKLSMNTNYTQFSIAVYGIDYQGNSYRVLLLGTSWTSKDTGSSILELDAQALDPANNNIPPCIGFAIDIACYTDYFELNWISILYRSRPPLVRRAIMIANDFDRPGRKYLVTWPFLVDPLGHNVTAKVTADGSVQTNLPVFTGNAGPLVCQWDNPVATGKIAQVWQIELICDDSMEVYKIEEPVIAQQMPTKVNYAIKPDTNFGKGNPKKIVTWPVVCNPTGKLLQMKVTIDGTTVVTQNIISADTRIRTFFWHNTNDLMGVDWRFEVYTTNPGDDYEFYEFLAPEVVQIFPIEKLLDQVGPFDLKAKGLVTAFRLRCMATNATVGYIVYEDDVSIATGNLTFSTSVDTAQIVELPKGIDPTVCRITFNSVGVFYRFSVELRVKLTGHDSEESFIKVTDKNV